MDKVYKGTEFDEKNGILRTSYNFFKEYMNKYDEKGSYLKRKKLRYKVENLSKKENAEFIKIRNDKVSEEVKTNRKHNEMLFGIIGELENDEMRDNLLFNITQKIQKLEKEKEKEEKKSLEKQKKISKKKKLNAQLTYVSTDLKVSPNFLNLSKFIKKTVPHIPTYSFPISRELLNNYLKNFYQREDWIYYDHGSFEDYLSQFQITERRKNAIGNSIKEEKKINFTEIEKNDFSVTENEKGEFCHECGKENGIIKFDTVLTNEVNINLFNFYVGIPDELIDYIKIPKKKGKYYPPRESQLKFLKSSKSGIRSSPILQSNEYEDSKFKKENIELIIDKERNFHLQYTYYGHLDSVKSIEFSKDIERPDLLFSASMDSTIKMWNIEDESVLKRERLKYYPLYTFLGHTGPVLKIKTSQEYIISTSEDCTVRVWEIPQKNVEFKNERRIKVGQINFFERMKFDQHKDIVWSVDMNQKNNQFVTVSSDKTIKYWDIENQSLLFSIDCVFENDNFEHLPTCVSFLANEKNKFIVSYQDSSFALYDVEKQKMIFKKKTVEKAINGKLDHLIYQILPLSKLDLVATAHEDGNIRLFDLKSGKQNKANTFLHQDAVTCLDESPLRTQIASSSTHCNVRLWDLRNFEILTDFAAGRPKGGEGTNEIKFHPLRDTILATADSDSYFRLYYNFVVKGPPKKKKKSRSSERKKINLKEANQFFRQHSRNKK